MKLYMPKEAESTSASLNKMWKANQGSIWEAEKSPSKQMVNKHDENAFLALFT